MKLNFCSSKFIFRSSSVLKYTEYKKEQALWLQIENDKRTDRGTNIEQFCIKKYRDYLIVVGHKDIDTFKQIERYLNNIGTYHITTGDAFWDKGYDKTIAENIEELMDKLLTKVNSVQHMPLEGKSFLTNVFRSIDWKWIGITYIVTMLFFGIVAVVVKNWFLLVGGFCATTFVVSGACIKIAWSIYKNDRLTDA